MIIDDLACRNDMTKTTISVESKQLDFVRNIAKISNSSVSAVIQYAIDQLQKQIQIEKKTGIDFDLIIQKGLK